MNAIVLPRRLAVISAAVLIAACGVANAEVKTYYAKTTPRGEMVLVGVTVERGDRVVTFDATSLIGNRVTHDLYRLARPADSVGQLQTAAVSPANSAPLNGFQVLAVGIDLSDPGYPDGAAVPGLFFQDKDGSGLLMDPVLIAGLPSPEPVNLLKEIPKYALGHARRTVCLHAMGIRRSKPVLLPSPVGGQSGRHGANGVLWQATGRSCHTA